MYSIVCVLFLLVASVRVSTGSFEIAQRDIIGRNCETGEPEGRKIQLGEICRSTLDCQQHTNDAICFRRADDVCICQVLDDGTEIHSGIASLRAKNKKGRRKRKSKKSKKKAKSKKKTNSKKNKSNKHKSNKKKPIKKKTKQRKKVSCSNSGGQCLNKDKQTCKSGFVKGLCAGASNIQCCYDCKNHDGKCQEDDLPCSGGYVSGSCNGPANIRCCKSAAAKKVSCSNSGGQCLNKDKQTCKNGFVKGLCAGASNVQCCYDCKNHDGKCQEDDLPCSGGYVSGSCNGPANIRCCKSAAVESSTCTKGGGQCVDVNENNCTSEFVSGGCPGKASIKCCYDCQNRDGVCQKITLSCARNYMSGFCNGPPSTNQCCQPDVAESRCTQEGGECKNSARKSCDSAFESGKCPGSKHIQCCKPGNGCDNTARQLACEIKNNSLITLANSHISGVTDDAYASLNIQQACNGLPAQRSAYLNTCKENIPAPGGFTCIDEDILRYVLAIKDKGKSFQVNEIAGGCHLGESMHYKGRAVDIKIFPTTTKATWQSWMDICTSMGGFAMGPQGDEHTGHVHCQI